MLDVDCSEALAASDIGAPGSPCVEEFDSGWLTVPEEVTCASAICLGNKIEFKVGCIDSSGK